MCSRDDVICPASARFDDTFTFHEAAVSPEQVMTIMIVMMMLTMSEKVILASGDQDELSGRTNGGLVPGELMNKTD